jgi:hypothetical protein
MKQLQVFRPELPGEARDACEIARLPIEARHEPERHRVGSHLENDWNCRGCCLGGPGRGNARRHDHAHLTADQIPPTLAIYRRDASTVCAFPLARPQDRC